MKTRLCPSVAFSLVASLAAVSLLVSVACARGQDGAVSKNPDSAPAPDAKDTGDAVNGPMIFPALTAGEAQEGFLTYYETSGRPKFNFITSVKKRFGKRLNHAVDPKQLSAGDRIKWQTIYKEMAKVGNRTVDTPQSLLVIGLELAKDLSVAFEKTGAIPKTGAWTIAVQATAPRHGFEKTPCAEFMSEVVREAYERGGYRLSDDFNTAKGNQLIWSNSAAVVNFSRNLYLAGWVPWETRAYRPVVGAIMLNGAGETPGHTYMSAGDDGRFIIDNSAPQGKDLRVVKGQTIGMEYESGVFFLPPGINPAPWL